MQIRITLGAALLLFVGGCGGCGPAPLGEACNPDADEPCDDDGVCVEDGDETLCFIGEGDSCDVDDDFCEPDTECIGTDDDAECIDPDTQCSPDNDTCGGGQVCEETAGGGYDCFGPLQLRGTVTDAADGALLAGALINALDAERSPVAEVATSDADGNYVLVVPSARNSDGTPTQRFFTMDARAQDHLRFPGGLRQALPIDISDATEVDGIWVINNALTQISLIALPAGQQGRPSVSGTVDAGELSAGVLVVAEGSGDAPTGLTDSSGRFTLFNVAAGTHSIRGYRAGVQLEPASVTVANDDVTGVELSVSSAALSTVQGSVQIVNAPGGSATSVVLIVEDTFDEVFVRGQVPPGLRSPQTGAPDVTGEFTISGVPDGRYVVLAGFENDDLVRDPDLNIAGTQIVHLVVPDPSDGNNITIDDSFKITEALGIISPGADEPEAVADPPTFMWEADSSVQWYDVEVFDALGTLVWQDDMVPDTDTSVVYGGPALEDGMIYQFRVTSWRAPGGNNASPISATEDLRGVFFLE